MTASLSDAVTNLQKYSFGTLKFCLSYRVDSIEKHWVSVKKDKAFCPVGRKYVSKGLTTPVATHADEKIIWTVHKPMDPGVVVIEKWFRILF